MLCPAIDRSSRRCGWLSVWAFLTLLPALVWGQAPTPFTLQFDTTTGSYAINYDTSETVVPWFSGGSTMCRNSQNLYSSTAKTLSLIRTSNTTGSEPVLGNYNVTEFYWASAADPSTPLMVTKIYTFPREQATNAFVTVFEQEFPQGLVSSSAGSNNELITGFPEFAQVNSDLNYLTYQDTFAAPFVGRWGQQQVKYPGGAQGGTPMVTYNKNGDALLVGPLDNFMVSAQGPTSTPSNPFAAGVQGLVDSLPPKFSHRTIVIGTQTKVAGMASVREALYTYGLILLGQSGKPRVKPSDDYTSKYLGYWTDNGAYYYYVTEANKNYQDTIVDVQKYLTQEGIPSKYLQFDSWWYPKGPKGGVTIWEPMKSVFPDGKYIPIPPAHTTHAYLPAPRSSLFNIMSIYDFRTLMHPLSPRIGMDPSWTGHSPLTLHNRYVSSESPYKQNYTFETDAGATILLPTDPAFFTHIMQLAKTWGMTVYEQDWLVTTYSQLNITQNNIKSAAKWMDAMAQGARATNVSIQYCMPMYEHILQSTLYPEVTQIRVSTDYNPGLRRNWEPVGLTSLLLDAMGVIPFKDCFWTTESQPGCKSSFPQCNEPNPDLETIIATLTTGPVGPADAIGKANVSRILSTCRKDGLLLKPDTPLGTHPAAFSIEYDDVSVPNIWWSQTEHVVNVTGGSIAVQWYYILSIALKDPQAILTETQVAPPWAGPFAYYNNVDPNPDLHLLTSTNPLPVATNTTVPSNQYLAPFTYFVVCPYLVAPNGDQWVVLGDTSKVVPMSSGRVSGLTLSSTPNQGSQLEVLLSGVAGENVVLSIALMPAQNDSTTTTTTATTSTRGSSRPHVRSRRAVPLRGISSGNKAPATDSVPSPSTVKCQWNNVPGVMKVTCVTPKRGSSSFSCECS